MSFAERASASASRFVAHFSSGSTITVYGGKSTFTAATATIDAEPIFYRASCSHPVPYAQRLIDGTRILADDLVTFIWADDPDVRFPPKPGMLVEVGEESYSIVSVQVNQGSYELQLRGGGA